MTRNTNVSADDFDKVRVALGRPNSSHVADEPEQEPSDPEAKPDAKGSRERSVDDGD
jgi:hypothetical protein